MAERYIIDANAFSNADQNHLQRDGKAYNLLECKRLKLNIPDTIIITGDGYDGYVRDGVIPREVARGMKQFIDSLTDGSPVLFAVRCGDKNKQKELPQSIVNAGLNEMHGKRYPEGFVEENKILYWRQVSRVTALLKQSPGIERYSDVNDLMRLPPLAQCMYAVRVFYEAFKQLSMEHVHFEGRSVIVQRMVFGNLDDRSCYGTAYTRHPYTGREMDYGQYMTKKQGIEANSIPDDMWKDMSELKTEMPGIYVELRETLTRIERFYEDIRFVEFIVESGVLYFIQLGMRNRIYFPHLFEPAG